LSAMSVQTLSRHKEILPMVSWAPNIFLGAKLLTLFRRMTHSFDRICRDSAIMISVLC
jgi:hypothetical protein